MNHTENSQAILGLTAEVVSAHVKNNHVDTAGLPLLIEQVYLALRHAGTPPASSQAAGHAAVQAPAGPVQAPVVSVKKSVFPDYIICLEDGRKMKTLKRYLRSTYNMTPEQYREKWGLPPEYPMVAPSYAEHRSALAKQAGLGRKPAAAAPQAAAAQAPMAPVTAPPAAAAAADPALVPEPAPAAPRPPQAAEVIAAPPVRESRTDHTLASVFSNFPRQADEDQDAGDAPAEGDERKPRRKPFSKQLARGMRR